jgi:HAD superfamily 5'-nucleotidase-like hydrolase
MDIYKAPPAGREIACNRTMNMRSIKAIGYDMDYTLIHYRSEAWEERAYAHIKKSMLERGWPVEDFEYDQNLIMRGLIIDIELGNIIKTNRFGYVKQAFHGTKPIPHQELQKIYSRTLVDLSDRRYKFLNTLFSLSEGCFFAQLVDGLDSGKIDGAVGYPKLHQVIGKALDHAHTEGTLKQDILSDPANFVVLDKETPLALLDQKKAGKKLLLITNSEWNYTAPVMSYAFDQFLPDGMVWQDLFDVTIVSSRKPSFFADPNPVFEIINDEGMLKPAIGGLKEGGKYLGGNAHMVEKLWGFDGEEILYVGDHIFADVRESKKVLRWRTALILRELETEMVALENFKEKQSTLNKLMRKKEELEYQYDQVRLAIQRKKEKYGPIIQQGLKELYGEQDKLKRESMALDKEIVPLAKESNRLMSDKWGLMMRAGNDKSNLARQIEEYADIYMSRVSNFLFKTPNAYLRSTRSSLPHDFYLG